MVHSLLPFRQLTRTAMPIFQVCRQPLVTQGVEMQVGEVVAPETFGRTRLRQLYEQRLIEPVGGTVESESRSAATFRRLYGNGDQVELAASPDELAAFTEQVSSLPFDLPDVPVVESQPQQSYTPSNRRSKQRST